MKARLLDRTYKYPVIELTTDDADFGTFNGVVEVHFLKTDINTGKRYLEPFVRVNVSLHHDMSPDSVIEWAEIIKAAGEVAKRMNPRYARITDVFTEAWMKIDEITAP